VVVQTLAEFAQLQATSTRKDHIEHNQPDQPAHEIQSRDPRAHEALSMKTLIRWLDWQRVRSLGELQILTRASYAMLAIVPILAGVWNVLPLGEPRSHYLPHSWVFAFFAALAVTFGQILYQVWAPELVRRSTRDQFVREKADEYANQPLRDRLEWRTLLWIATHIGNSRFRVLCISTPLWKTSLRPKL
jgi:hypothetical protein